MKNPQNTAAALRTAQRWLRELSKEEFGKWLETLPLNRNQKTDYKDWLRKQDTYPFKNPHYWAAFYTTGQ